MSYRLEEELDRSSHHASANVDLHVYTQRLENECRDLRCQITTREQEKLELNEIITDLELQVSVFRQINTRIIEDFHTDKTLIFNVLDQTIT